MLGENVNDEYDQRIVFKVVSNPKYLWVINLPISKMPGLYSAETAQYLCVCFLFASGALGPLLPSRGDCKSREGRVCVCVCVFKENKELKSERENRHTMLCLNRVIISVYKLLTVILVSNLI